MISSFTKWVVVVGTVCGVAMGAYLLTPNAWLLKPKPYDPCFGKDRRISDPQVVVGDYAKGGILRSIYVDLCLDSDMSYTATSFGCGWTNGVEQGRWKIVGSRLNFMPDDVDDLFPDRLGDFEVRKFEGNWILVPTDFRGLTLYEEWGIAGSTCFQRTNAVFRSGL